MNKKEFVLRRFCLGSSHTHDDRQTSGINESGFRRGGVNNRGGFGDRGGNEIFAKIVFIGFSIGRGGYNDRNMGRNNDENNENNSASSGGFSSK